MQWFGLNLWSGREDICRACTAGGSHRRSEFMSMLCQIQHEDVILSLWGDTSWLPCFKAHCKQAVCSVPAARISDLIWKEALVDDLVLPAAQWPKYVFLLTYTGAFNLLLYWALFDFTYHYHNDMLVESRANHGLCTVPTSNVIRLN